MSKTDSKGPKFRAYTIHDLDRIPELACLDEDRRVEMRAVAEVLPFRVNPFVVRKLIDWDAVPDDPLFHLVFPQPGMLEADDLDRMVSLIRRGAPREEIVKAARDIQGRLNPHPAGQVDLNVPQDRDGRRHTGIQHKYRETVVFFPAAGQTCHAYCSYCFRWPQFVDHMGMRFAENEAARLVRYLKDHREVTSVLITGGDPMIMKTRILRSYVEPLLTPELAHVTSIRIGTKSLVYWPYRFTHDADADDALRLFEEVRASGRVLAMMAHYAHPRELDPAETRHALERVRAAGAEVYGQAPVTRHVNDDPGVWKALLEAEVRHGILPYYMFVERDTGARNYFEIPLIRAHEIFADAYRQVTGLARTVRGPTMSCLPGKALIDDVLTVNGERVFALKFLQARNPKWVGRVFFARFDSKATWFDQLRPAHGDSRFFFEEELDRMRAAGRMQVWLDE